MIETDHPELTIALQCELVAISRSGFSHRPAGESMLNLELVHLIDEQLMGTPWCGSRQIARQLRSESHVADCNRVHRMMARMGLATIYQRPHSAPGGATHD